jgi:hypothetical protein
MIFLNLSRLFSFALLEHVGSCGSHLRHRDSQKIRLASRRKVERLKKAKIYDSTFRKIRVSLTQQFYKFNLLAVFILAFCLPVLVINAT